MTSSREQFEQCAIKRAEMCEYKHPQSMLKRHGDGYATTWVDMMWEGWQASRQCIEVELPYVINEWAGRKDYQEYLNRNGIKVKQ